VTQTRGGGEDGVRCSIAFQHFSDKATVYSYTVESHRTLYVVRVLFVGKVDDTADFFTRLSFLYNSTCLVEYLITYPLDCQRSFNDYTLSSSLMYAASLARQKKILVAYLFSSLSTSRFRLLAVGAVARDRRRTRRWGLLPLE
jgi:hypothetical protein